MIVKTKTTATRTTRNDDSNDVINWALADTWKVEMKFKAYTGVDTTREKFFYEKDDASTERTRLIKKITKDGGMNIIYPQGDITEMFVFASQFCNVTLHIVKATEKIRNVKGILAA